jgi:hypothetical protein
MVARRDARDAAAGGDDMIAQAGLVGGKAGDEGFGIALEIVAAAHDLDARLEVLWRAHLDRHAEAVEQLRPEFAFFRVARADENELRRMTHAEPLALDDVLARSGDIEQQIDQMIFE